MKTLLGSADRQPILPTAIHVSVIIAKSKLFSDTKFISIRVVLIRWLVKIKRLFFGVEAIPDFRMTRPLCCHKWQPAVNQCRFSADGRTAS